MIESFTNALDTSLIRRFHSGIKAGESADSEMVFHWRVSGRTGVWGEHFFRKKTPFD